MLDRDIDKRARLIQARDLFERTFEHYEDSRGYMEEDICFYHNVDGESQWDQEDLKYLREQNRPALTFNLIFNKVNQAIGLHEDHRHRPRVVPASGSPTDIAMAEVANNLLEQARKCASMDAVDSQVYEYAVVMGEGDAQISVDLDPETPGWLKFAAIAQTGLQVLWDTASEAVDRSDARYVIWDKWVNIDNFIVDYPEFKDTAKRMLDGSWNGAVFVDGGAGGFDATVIDGDDYEAEFGDANRSAYYVDRKYKKIRVVHVEYEMLVKKHFIISSTERQEVDGEFAAEAKKARDAGDMRFAGVSIISTYDTEVFWFEFIGTDVLYDDESPEPHGKFSLSSMICFQDTHSGYPYGIVRNMKDPQRDVNKAHSQSLDHLNAQAKPGWIAEQNAIPNEEQFQEAVKQSSSVAYVAAGALAGGMVQARAIPTYSEAANQRLDQAVTLLNLVSGISSEPEDPGRGVEAATTVAIRERKALRALTRVLRHFERYQIHTSHLFLEAIVKGMPDDQIAAWLGDGGDFRVQGGQIVKLDKESGQGQPVAQIREFRLFKYAIELEPSSTSEVTRLMMLNIIMQLAATQVGIPIDPDIVYELMATDRATRERLRSYAEMANQQQAQASQMQMQMLQSQTEADLKEADAKAGTAINDAKQQSRELDMNTRVKILDLWIKADATEKKFIMDIMNLKKQSQSQSPQ